MWTFLLFFLYTQLVNTRPLISRPDYEFYHTKDSLMKEVRSIVEKNPSFMKIEEKIKGDANYSVSMPVVTIEPGGFTTNQSEKIRLVMSFGEHGRELITTELALRLLLSFDNEANIRQHTSSDFTRLQQILKQTVWKVIPIENPNGRALVEKGQLCERKNGRGVDINRNWDIDFGEKEKDYDPFEEYPGEFPFSEPENVLLKELSLGFKQHVWVGVHSGTCAVFMPYDHIGVIPNGTSAEAQLRILESIKTESLNKKCKFGPGGKTVGYLAHGTATDYMYSALNVPLSFTWEIYGDESASFEECYKMFNPTKKPGFEETLSQWISAIFHLVTLLPDHPDIPYSPPPIAEDLSLSRQSEELNLIKNNTLVEIPVLETPVDVQLSGLNRIVLLMLVLVLSFVTYIIFSKRKRKTYTPVRLK